MSVTETRVPWHEFGSMLPELAMGNRALMEIGLRLPSAKLTNRYFSWLQSKGLIRLKTQAEIMAEFPETAS